MKLGIRTKLFLLSLSLIALTLGITYGYLRRTLDANMTTRIEQELAEKLRLIAHTAEQTRLSAAEPRPWQELARAMSPLAAGRVTLVREDGMPLGDSDVEGDGLSGLPNHLSRPEIADAQHRMQYSHFLSLPVRIGMPRRFPEGGAAVGGNAAKIARKRCEESGPLRHARRSFYR